MKRTVLLQALSASMLWACSNAPPKYNSAASFSSTVGQESGDGGAPSSNDKPNKGGGSGKGGKKKSIEPDRVKDVEALDDLTEIEIERPSDFLSRGEGGQPGYQEQLAVSGIQYLMKAPENVHTSGRSYGLLILLHRNAANGYRNYLNAMKEVAARYDLIPVSVLAPNGASWNEGDKALNARALHRLIQKDLVAKFNIDLRRVVFSGASSGAAFLSSFWIPEYAKLYQGGAFMQCGAAPPPEDFEADADTRNGFRLHFEITKGDGIFEKGFQKSVADYELAGMQVTANDTKAGGHCAYDESNVILDNLNFILGLSLN